MRAKKKALDFPRRIDQECSQYTTGWESAQSKLIVSLCLVTKSPRQGSLSNAREGAR